MDLFDKLITPIFNYGSEVWGFYPAKSVETTHMSFCKRMLKVKQTTQNDFVHGELGRVDYQSLRYINIVKFWLKLIQTDERKYIRLTYNMMLNDLEMKPNKQNWASMVKHLLSRLGFFEVWNAQGVGNICNFISAVKTRVKDIYTQDWHSRLEKSSRARFYVNIANFKCQTYLNALNIEKYRRSLCKFRVSAHRLEVETGRWTKPVKTPLNERICFICGVLEDEFHFILECPLYSDLRQNYIQRYYWQRANMPKLIQLMTAESVRVIKKTLQCSSKKHLKSAKM